MLAAIGKPREISRVHRMLSPSLKPIRTLHPSLGKVRPICSQVTEAVIVTR
jgi:hypothetical protein